MKLSDYVAKKVVELGIESVFMVTGGGSMHLNHSLGTNKNINCIFNHHEQAAAMAAESYFRLTNKPALVNVTSGPGGTNAITGVYGAWTDSLGMIVISGQVKYETTVRSTGLNLRQYGDQELDIEKLVSPITKYVTMVTDPNSIRYHIEKAFYLSTNGRPGPCWLDIPLDVQGAEIDPESLEKFDPPMEIVSSDFANECKVILKKIIKAERPVVFAGGGVRLSGAHSEFIKLVEKLGIPVVTGWNAHDVVTDSHPLYSGRPGTVGNREGNFTVQNSDLLLILGSRLNIRQISYKWESFARGAYKIWIDIDSIELQKPTVKAELKICADLSEILPKLNNMLYDGPTDAHKKWLKWCLEKKGKYPIVEPEYWKTKKINPYAFMQTLFRQFKENQIIVTADGSACVIGFQAAEIKKGQRLWTNSGCCSMGYDLPAAIGACIGSKRQSIVCLAGDGSIMMNLQELQTIYGNNLPIKIIILNNSGYSSIFQTHKNFFNGVEVGASPKSGLTFPDFSKISKAFNIPYYKCIRNDEDDIKINIQSTLNENGPAILEVILDEDQPFAPKLASRQMPDGSITSPNLEDMAPFLSRDDLKNNMLI
jgi:acetolactate synthase I/II/III large subunit